MSTALKRYRYRNSFGIVNPALGMGDWAGRLAFCDALFMLNDDALLERVAGAHPHGGPDLALKAVLVMLAYGKADLAAWIHDASAEKLSPEVRAGRRIFRASAGIVRSSACTGNSIVGAAV